MAREGGCPWISQTRCVGVGVEDVGERGRAQHEGGEEEEEGGEERGEGRGCVVCMRASAALECNSTRRV